MATYQSPWDAYTRGLVRNLGLAIDPPWVLDWRGSFGLGADIQTDIVTIS